VFKQMGKPCAVGVFVASPDTVEKIHRG
jgi:hypothetical protein